MANDILTNRKIKKYNINFKSAYTSTKYTRFIQMEMASKVRMHNLDTYKHVPCPKCGNKLVVKHDDNLDHVYVCPKDGYTMEFSQYQKMFINLNWSRQIKNGIVLYSWDGICPNCGQMNPFLSYCLNENFGTEELCEYEPILLGNVPKIDAFIMRYCRAINQFPNKKGELSAHIFCSKCDAPIPYDKLVDSFLNQKVLDVEYVIKKEAIQKINLAPEDITKTLNYLVLLDPIWSE